MKRPIFVVVACVAAAIGASIGIAAVMNPVAPSGQPQIFANYQQARAISAGTRFPVTRAIYNGNASACDITLILNLDVTPIDFHNVPSGAVLSGFMATEVTPTGCSNLVALY
jgi:hypothetical protein